MTEFEFSSDGVQAYKEKESPIQDICFEKQYDSGTLFKVKIKMNNGLNGYCNIDIPTVCLDTIDIEQLSTPLGETVKFHIYGECQTYKDGHIFMVSKA